LRGRNGKIVRVAFAGVGDRWRRWAALQDGERYGVVSRWTGGDSSLDRVCSSSREHGDVIGALFAIAVKEGRWVCAWQIAGEVGC